MMSGCPDWCTFPGVHWHDEIQDWPQDCPEGAGEPSKLDRMLNRLGVPATVDGARWQAQQRAIGRQDPNDLPG